MSVVVWLNVLPRWLELSENVDSIATAAAAVAADLGQQGNFVAVVLIVPVADSNLDSPNTWLPLVRWKDS